MTDVGAIVLAAVSAFAAGASAIIAWAARADALKSADRAEAAQQSALRAWQDSAAALKESNDLSREQYDERLRRERKIRRVEVAEHFRRWYTEDAMRRLLGQRMSDREKAEKRELLIKMTATGEPGASVVATVIIEAVQKVVPGDMSSVVAAAAKISTATHQWIEDPEAYTESVRSDFTADRIGDRIVSATGLMEEAMGGRSESTDTPE